MQSIPVEPMMTEIVTDDTIAVPDSTATTWHDAAPFIGGRGFNDTPGLYNRLPAAAQADVHPGIFGLSKASSGLFLQFSTNASSISFNMSYSTTGGNNPTNGQLSKWSNFRPTGYSGNVHSHRQEFVGADRALSTDCTNPEHILRRGSIRIRREDQDLGLRSDDV
jgi:hypothetical protein